MRRSLSAVVAIGILVLSGCSHPATLTPTPSPTTDVPPSTSTARPATTAPTTTLAALPTPTRVTTLAPTMPTVSTAPITPTTAITVTVTGETLPPGPPSTSTATSPGLISGPSSIKRGQTATINVQGVPGTQYQIKVVYHSGATGTAQELEPKIAEADGTVSWSWIIRYTVSPGRAIATVSGGGGFVAHSFTVIQ